MLLLNQAALMVLKMISHFDGDNKMSTYNRVADAINKKNLAEFSAQDLMDIDDGLHGSTTYNVIRNMVADGLVTRLEHKRITPTNSAMLFKANCIIELKLRADKVKREHPWKSVYPDLFTLPKFKVLGIETNRMKG